MFASEALNSYNDNNKNFIIIILYYILSASLKSNLEYMSCNVYWYIQSHAGAEHP